MTTFLNGPAQNDGRWVAGETPLRRAAAKPLLLRRAPHFLRAVCNPAGEWDALDQLHDVPAADETIFAYEMVSGPSSMHICARGKHRESSGWYQGGDYRVCDPQPIDEQLRVTASWRFWCAERIGKPVAEDGSIQQGDHL